MIYTKEIETRESYDTVVLGGGLSGFSAAYAAAREGSRVILIERGFELGGVATQALVNHILGVRALEDGVLYTCVGDIFDILEKRLLSEGAAVDVRPLDLTLHPHGWYTSLGTGLIFDCEKMKLLLETMLEELGVKILYGTHLVDLVKEGEKIKCALVHNKSGFYAIEGKYFVDTTGDADACRLAGCPAEKGDEEGGMSAASLEMHVEGVDDEKLFSYMKETGDVRFKAIIKRLVESGEWKFPYFIFISVKMVQNGVYMINTIRQVGVDGADADSLTRGVIDGRSENYELLRIMRTYFPGFENARVRKIASSIGIRETYRIVGEGVLKVDDLIEAKHREDSIALSSYGWDLPDPKRPTYSPMDTTERSSRYAEIPYGALLPKGVDNLIAAGRCISTERQALGPVRVMGPCIAVGTAAGIAVALAQKDNVAMRDVSVSELRKAIVSYGGIVNRTCVKVVK